VVGRFAALGGTAEAAVPTGSEGSRRGIGESGQGIGVVGLDADYYALVQEDPDPDAEADHDGHWNGMDLPVGAIDTHDFVASGDDLGGAGDGGAVLASDVGDDVGIAADALDLVGIAGSQEFDLALVNAEPDVDLRQFSGFLVGAEPLSVASEGVL
jgi:hypothetical protein